MAVTFGLVESVTFAVKLNVPAVVGVPEITPAFGSLRPAGSAPADSDPPQRIPLSQLMSRVVGPWSPTTTVLSGQRGSGPSWMTRSV